MLIRILNRAQLFFITKKVKPALKLDKNLLGARSSKEKLEVIIPCLDKDLVTLPVVVESLRRFLNHPMGNIYIVAPADARKIKAFCKESSCVFVDEKDVAPLPIEGINYKPGGQNRAGWIYQQLIKLSGDSIAQTPNFLVWDADTALTMPQAYMQNARFVINHSDEHHAPYFKNYEKLMGRKPVAPVSLIAHQMIFSKNILREIKDELENLSGEEWWQAILSSLDENEPSSFSEYELYGNYLLSHHSNKMIIEYWFNITLPRKDLMTVDEIHSNYSGHFKTASWHSYN